MSSPLCRNSAAQLLQASELPVSDEIERRSDFYSIKYASFGSETAVVLRREIFGDDIGQEGWSTAAEHAEIVDLLGVGRQSRVLDVCCGSGGPSLALAQRIGCRLTGVDRENAAIAYARAQASARNLAERATFALADCNKSLPFEDHSFDSLLCIDAILHLRDRFGTLREWARLLRSGGRLAFTDLAVVTGEIAKSELDIRTASGFFLFVPPGLNEAAIEAAGLNLQHVEDRTGAVAEIGARTCSARMRHAQVLEREEGVDGFGRRQELYAMAVELAKSRRLSRFLYVAEKSRVP
jgi:SAM-dependent methyltransferase